MSLSLPGSPVSQRSRDLDGSDSAASFSPRRVLSGASVYSVASGYPGGSGTTRSAAQLSSEYGVLGDSSPAAGGAPSPLEQASLATAAADVEEEPPPAAGDSEFSYFAFAQPRDSESQPFSEAGAADVDGQPSGSGVSIRRHRDHTQAADSECPALDTDGGTKRRRVSSGCCSAVSPVSSVPDELLAKLPLHAGPPLDTEPAT